MVPVQSSDPALFQENADDTRSNKDGEEGPGGGVTDSSVLNIGMTGIVQGDSFLGGVDTIGFGALKDLKTSLGIVMRFACLTNNCPII
jgi:hypothetical protein